jgi:hypothetical protein
VASNAGASAPKRGSTHPTVRAGATLTEVLIALLIMSIGLVSLAVLFPISVLRSVKAAQFTTATDARYNAEAMMDLYPRMIRDPGYIGTNLTTNFIVDPLGFAIVNQSLPANANNFGTDPNPPAGSGIAAGPFPSLKRYPFFQTSALTAAQQEASADFMVTMPDSWVVQFEGPGVLPKAVPTSATGTTQIDVTGLNASGFTAIPAGITARALIFSADGLTSQARFLTSVGSGTPQSTVDTVVWTEDKNANNALDPGEDVNGNGNLDHYPLPASFVPGGKVRIELQERRYTWLLTLRPDALGKSASVDVVVFFKRKFEVNVDEMLYQANFLSGVNNVTITYTAATKPFMHKGNYIFDANNAFWYRISNVNDNGTGSATIYFDVPANASSPVVPTGANSTATYGRAMFPRNIVDVYPIGSK